MASPRVDTQLMDNYIAADPLPAVDEIAAVYDENHHPMLFYINSQDKKLWLLYREPKTAQNHAPVCLSDQLKLTTPVTHVEAHQTADLAIHLAIAVAQPDGYHAQLCLFMPTSPDQLRTGLSDRILTVKPHPLDIVRILLAAAPREKYPHVAVIAQSTMNQQVYLVKVDIATASWSWSDSWTLAANPSAIVDICFATVNSVPSLWVLDAHNQGNRVAYKLTAYGSDPRYGPVVRSVDPPPSVTDHASLAAFVNHEGHHDLLVVGAGLHHYRADQFAADGAQPNTLSQKGMFERSKHLTVGQYDSTTLHLWFNSINSSDGSDKNTMSFCKLNQATLGQTKDVIATPLTNDHKDGRFVSLVPPHDDPAYQQHFLYINSSARVLIAAQAKNSAVTVSDSQLSIPMVEKILPVQSYTSQVTFPSTGAKGDKRKVTISVEGNASATPIVNGVRHTITSTQPLNLELLPNQPLNIIHLQEHLTVPILKIAHDGATDILRLDPTKAATDKMMGLNTVKALQEATISGPNGTREPLLTDKQMKDTALLQETAQKIASLQVRGSKLPTDNEAGHDRIVVMGFFDFVDDAWNWIQEQGHKVIKFIEEVGEGIKKIAIDFGNFARDIAISTWHDIARVGTVVLQTLEIGWDRLKRFFGAVFDWSAIMSEQRQMHSELSGVLSIGKGFFDGAMDGLQARISAIIKDVESDLDVLDVLAEGDLTNLGSLVSKGGSPSDDIAGSAKGSIITNAISSMSDSNSKIPAGAVIRDDSTNGPLIDKIVKSMTTWITQPGKIDHLKGIFDDFHQALSLPLNAKSVIKIFKDTIKLLLEFLDLVLTETVQLVKLAGDTFLDALDEEISIPIITPLLKFASRMAFGTEIQFPSVLGVIAFVMAVIRVEQKAFTNRADGSENIKFELKKFLPTPTRAHDMAKNWVAGTPLGGTTARTMTMTTTTGIDHVGRGEHEVHAMFFESTHRQNYSLVSSVAHPIVLTADMIFQFPMTWIRVMGTSAPTYASPPKLCHWIEVGVSICDNAFGFPGVDSRPGIAKMISGWALMIVDAILMAFKPLFEERMEAFAMEAIDCILRMVKLGVYSASIKDGLSWTANPDATPGDRSGYTTEIQQDKDDLELTIGNVVCGATASLSRFCIALGGVMMWELPPPFDAVGFIGAEAIPIAGIINVASAISDCGVDWTRGKREWDKSTHGSYSGMHH